MKLKELRQLLDELLPSQGMIDYCPNGLQIEGTSAVHTVATAVTASMKTIEMAIENQVNALIVHHGLFWNKDSYVIEGSKKNKIALLLENKISLFAYHLPLDLHPTFGNNWKAACDMKWTKLENFAGIGVKGVINPISREDFKQILESYYQHSATCAWGGKDMISSVALISGGAHRNIMDAVHSDVDAFITGSFDEPTWHQAFEEKINFFALGHAATERVGPIALCHYLKQHASLPCVFLDSINPF